MWKQSYLYFDHLPVLISLKNRLYEIFDRFNDSMSHDRRGVVTTESMTTNQKKINQPSLSFEVVPVASWLTQDRYLPNIGSLLSEVILSSHFYSEFGDFPPRCRKPVWCGMQTCINFLTTLCYVSKSLSIICIYRGLLISVGIVQSA